MTKQRIQQKGTTLIELLFSIFILSSLVFVITMFPPATRRNRRSTSDQRATIVARSLKDAVVTAMKSSFLLTKNPDSPRAIKIVHDGLSHEDYYTKEMMEGELTIELPTGAEPIENFDEETLIDSDDPTAPIYYLLYKNNEPVRYPDEEGEEKVFKLAQNLLDKESDYYNKDDEIRSYSFDIEVRQAVRERRPRRGTGEEFAGSAVRIYELVPETYEFTINIYRGWRPLNEREKEQNAANATLVRSYRFNVHASR
jgi:competence protein ComGC